MAWAAAPELNQARQHYQKAEYAQTLAVLGNVSPKDAQTWMLIGKSNYGLEKYADATDALERAVKLAPENADAFLWLGRAWGRRAETSAPWNQFRYAGKAREAFEHSLELDPENRGALDDLFEYYVEAPGIVGGGTDKAEKLVPRMTALSPAWGQKAMARLSEKRDDYVGAEMHLRKAVELAPNKPGPELDLAKFLAHRNRVEESDEAFAKALKLGPRNPEVLFGRAKTYWNQKRNLDEARQLLQRYLIAELTPEDTPRSEAQDLLDKIGKQ